MGRGRSVSAFIGAVAVLLAACGDGGGAPPQAHVDIAHEPDPVFPEIGSTRYDVRHYDWDLTVDPTSGSLALLASLDAVATAPLDAIVLDYSGPELSVVRVDGEDRPHTVSNGKLVIDSDRAEGEGFQVVVESNGVPDPATVEGLPGRFGWISTGDGVHTLAVFPGNTASWVPFNDTPLDPATFDIAVTVPDGYVATASGRHTGLRTRDGSSTFEYRVEQPVTEVAVAVGDFAIERFEGEDVEVDLALPVDGGPGIDAFADVPRMVQFLTDRLGPLPFSNIGFTFLDGLNGDADSTPGRIHIRATSPAVLVHELAHQWMGAMVSTSSMAESWLREGLPTYMELLWMEHEGMATVDGTVALRRQQLGPSTRIPLDVTAPRHRVDDVTYHRGALTFHALHAEIGDEAFTRGLQHFFRRHAGTSATTEDFMTAMSDSSGRDLETLFDQWLRAEELPPPPSSAIGS